MTAASTVNQRLLPKGILRKYCRIVSSHEKCKIIRESRIDFNAEEWGIYNPGTVVFVFDCSQTSPDFLRSVAETMVDANSREQWLLLFETTIETEQDQSGNWQDCGAEICRSQIELSGVGKIRWQRYVPNASFDFD